MGTKKNKKKGKGKNKGKNKFSQNENTGRRKKLKQIAAENFGKFCEQLNKIGLRIKESGGDGNCLFRSFSDQMEGSEDNYKFYRAQTMEYIIANRDNFEPFIEDDQKFDDYVEEMSKDGKWGGNLEIQALAMRFGVNFYIHIYNHPMYIVRNFDTPMRNIHLSYHDGNHYNSVRLKDDYNNDIPIPITDDVLQGVQQTSDMATLLNLEEQTNEKLDKEEESKSGAESDEPYEEEYNKYQKEKVEEKKSDELRYKGILIKDLEEKAKKKKYTKKILCKDGAFRVEIGNGDITLDDNKKCHCCSNKKYRVCCKADDIPGDFDDKKEEFFCEIEKFIIFYSTLEEPEKEKKERKKDSEEAAAETQAVEKKLSTIFI